MADETEQTDEPGVTQADVVDAGIRLLARREHATGELRRKLSDRFDDAELIDAALTELATAGYLSDTRYAEAKLRSGINRGHGPMKIRQAMRQAGVDDEQIDAAFEAEAVDWCDLAADALQSRFGNAPSADRREQARRARFLSSRGYPGDLIAQLVLND